MNVYLLKDRQTDRVIDVYINEQDAIIAANRVGVAQAFSRMFNGGDNSNRYVEVRRVIETNYEEGDE